MKNYKELYRIEQLPVFQNRMYDSEQDARNCPKGDMRLVEDLDTGLIYNASFSPELMVYDKHYQNEQAVSVLFQKHLDEVADIVTQTLGTENVVEVGCGKGQFLELLLRNGCNVTGFDPTYEGLNPRIKRRYFEPGAVSRANGLILRHVLEHIPDPIAFLEQLKISNGGVGRIYIEVPCFDWICDHKAWFDVFYEHVNYFRLSDFHRMFREVIESGRIFGGQYLYVVAELGSLRAPVINMADRVKFPADFDTNLAEHANTNQNGSAIWGGASKGVIFALFRERAGSPIQTVIDINPAKQGRYLPYTGLLVKSPQQALGELESGSTIYVMNSNYLDEIKKMSGNSFNYIPIDHE